MITTLEELSLNAWASLQTVFYDGWVIRFADGYTKRANSVNPIYPSRLDISQKLRFCEDLYQRKELPVVFKLTPVAYPDNLDEILSAKGYQKDSPTSVQTMDLETRDMHVSSQIEIQEAPCEEWLEAFCSMSALSEKNRNTLREILFNMIPQQCFVSLRSQDKVIGCGLGVLQADYIGLFDIMVDKDFRGRGYGQQVVESILAWGKQHNASKAYLQVMLDNAPALRLYSKIGFTEQYQYWYRIKDRS